jgi:hypothetical protein
MERAKLFELMDELKLHGMKAVFDEIMATAFKRQHEPQRIIGDLLKAEIALADLRQPTITHHASRAGAFRFRRVVRLPSIAMDFLVKSRSRASSAPSPAEGSVDR